MLEKYRAFDSVSLYTSAIKTKEKTTGIESGNCLLFSTFSNRFGLVSSEVGLRETKYFVSVNNLYAIVRIFFTILPKDKQFTGQNLLSIEAKYSDLKTVT